MKPKIFFILSPESLHFIFNQSCLDLFVIDLISYRLAFLHNLIEREGNATNIDLFPIRVGKWFSSCPNFIFLDSFFCNSFLLQILNYLWILWLLQILLIEKILNIRNRDANIRRSIFSKLILHKRTYIGSLDIEVSSFEIFPRAFGSTSMAIKDPAIFINIESVEISKFIIVGFGAEYTLFDSIPWCRWAIVNC